MKTILKLNSIKQLSKEEQQTINGGIRRFRPIECEFSEDVSTDWCCHLPLGCPSDN